MVSMLTKFIVYRDFRTLLHNLIARKRKHDKHFTSTISELHWLPINFRNKFNLCVLVYNHCEGTLTPYLSFYSKNILPSTQFTFIFWQNFCHSSLVYVFPLYCFCSVEHSFQVSPFHTYFGWIHKEFNDSQLANLVKCISLMPLPWNL